MHTYLVIANMILISAQKLFLLEKWRLRFMKIFSYFLFLFCFRWFNSVCAGRTLGERPGLPVHGLPAGPGQVQEAVHASIEAVHAAIEAGTACCYKDSPCCYKDSPCCHKGSPCCYWSRPYCYWSRPCCYWSSLCCYWSRPCCYRNSPCYCKAMLLKRRPFRCQCIIEKVLGTKWSSYEKSMF